jgi:hypothetical protein
MIPAKRKITPFDTLQQLFRCPTAVRGALARQLHRFPLLGCRRSIQSISKGVRGSAMRLIPSTPTITSLQQEILNSCYSRTILSSARMHLRKSLVAAAGLTQSSLALAIQDQSPLGIHLYGNSEVTIGRRPNVILILTDDQDLHMNSLDYMPLLQKHMADQGAQYKKHFCTTAICCPARVSLLTGRLAHNTNVTDVYPPYGRSERSVWI